MSGGIPTGLADRMAVAIHAYVSGDGSIIASGNSVHAEFCEIAGLLPPPVDPDLIEARRLAADGVTKIGEYAASKWCDRILSGECDGDPSSSVPTVLAAIKRGRALASLQARGDQA